MRRTPTPARSPIDRAARKREDVDRDADLAHDPRDLIQIDEAWRVDHVGPGVAVGDETRDRVVEVVDAADVVLGPRGQDEWLDIRVRGRHGLGDSLHRHVERVDAVGSGVVVLDREARAPASERSRTVSATPPGSSG